MKKLIVYLLCVICFFSCKKNEYLDVSVEDVIVEFSSTNLSETISFISTGDYDIAVPVQIFGGTSTAQINVAVETKMPSDAYSVESSKKLNGSSLDTIHVKVNCSKLKKGTVYAMTLKISSLSVGVSKNYEKCDLEFSQQAFMDFFAGNYSCYESATGATYDVDFTKMNDTTIKNNNFYDFPLAGQYVPYVFVQDDSKKILIPENTEWIDNLGNKYVVSGEGAYELNGNFYVNFVMEDAATESVYLTGKHTFKKQ